MYIVTSGTWRLPQDDVFSLVTLFYLLFLYSWFDHIYHSAILMPESAPHSYKYDRHNHCDVA